MTNGKTNILQLDATLVVVGNTDLFLDKHVLGVDIRWSVNDPEDCGKASNQHPVPDQTDTLFFLLTFGTVGGAPGVERLFVDVNHISSDELGALALLRFLMKIDFTYLMRSSVQ